jgi:hypothetical protein
LQENTQRPLVARRVDPKLALDFVDIDRRLPLGILVDPKGAAEITLHTLSSFDQRTGFSPHGTISHPRSLAIR